jgi:hypothetical protein
MSDEIPNIHCRPDSEMNAAPSPVAATPRTDAVEWIPDADKPKDGLVRSSVMRQIERELIATKAERGAALARAKKAEAETAILRSELNKRNWKRCEHTVTKGDSGKETCPHCESDLHWNEQAKRWLNPEEENAWKESLEERWVLEMVHAANRETSTLRAKLAEAERAKERAFDCHAGPGTTEPACGACITCLTNRLAEAEADTKRLLWLNQHVRCVDNFQSGFRIIRTNGVTVNAPDLRAAIDAATEPNK